MLKVKCFSNELIMHLLGEKKPQRRKKMREIGKKTPKSKVCTIFLPFPSASKTDTVLEAVNIRLKESKNAELNSFRKTCYVQVQLRIKSIYIC